MNRGFTLIELLIVIAILGILAAVLFVTIGGTPQRDARDSRRLADFNNLATATALYRSENNTVPDSVAGSSNSLVNGPGGASYIGGAPADPRDNDTGCENTAFTPNFPGTGYSTGDFGYYYEKYTASDGSEKALLAVCLEKTTHPALNGSFEDPPAGSVQSAAFCDSPVYCIAL
jgi:prepilin-type N-terminal cleavage/methylation domain-containing protein